MVASYNLTHCAIYFTVNIEVSLANFSCADKCIVAMLIFFRVTVKLRVLIRI